MVSHSVKGLFRPALLALSAVILIAGCNFATAPTAGDTSGSSGSSNNTPTPVTYSVIYDGNGNTGGSVPVDSGKYASLATATIKGNTGSLIKTGFDFSGWSISANGNGATYAAGATLIISSANIKLYAVWVTSGTTVNRYSVTYNGNGSTGGTVPTDAGTYPAGAALVLPGNTGTLVKTGQVFAGWSLVSGGTGPVYAAGSSLAIPASNITLYAVWSTTGSTVTRYTVTFNGNGNTSGSVPVDTATYSPGAPVSIPGNPGSLAKTGSTFIGWNTAADGKGTNYTAGTTVAMGTSNMTLYANWTQGSTFTVTYNGNENTGGAVPVDTGAYLSGASVTVMANTGSLEKTGYAFAGWNSLANGTGVTYPAGSTFAIGTANVTLYAVWNKLTTFTVTYNENGGWAAKNPVPIDSKTYLTGATVTVFGNTGNLIKDEYVFSGWNTSSDGMGTTYQAGATFIMGSANVTLYAVWVEKLYKITYFGNGNTGGTVPVDTNGYKKYASVKMAGNTGNMTKTGLVFAGWSETATDLRQQYLAGDSFSVLESKDYSWYAIWQDPALSYADARTYSGGCTATFQRSNIAGSNDGTHGEAHYNAPTSIAYNGVSWLYVFDSKNHAIRLLDDNTNPVTTIANGTTGYADGTGAAAKFSDSIVLTGKSNGDAYFVDSGNNLVRMCTHTGVITTLAGGGSATGTLAGYVDGVGRNAKFNNPSGIVEGLSQLYVADTGNNLIRKISISGSTVTVTTLAGGGSAGGTAAGYADGVGTAAKFNAPTALAFDMDNNLWVADTGNNLIRKVNIMDGTVTTIAGGGSPTGVAAGYADGTGRNAKFNGPLGIVVFRVWSSNTNIIFVSDTGNNLVRKIMPDGTVTTFAGGGSINGTAAGYANDIGYRAKFAAPMGIVCNSSMKGVLYLADRDNNVIRAIYP